MLEPAEPFNDEAEPWAGRTTLQLSLHPSSTFFSLSLWLKKEG